MIPVAVRPSAVAAGKPRASGDDPTVILLTPHLAA